ncbi:MAG TPA: hypothetical protein VFX39_10050 [Gemmatimonadaceae bacterium]|nr:hypothetical protein [Gemmatimonadaceae bacterium]
MSDARADDGVDAHTDHRAADVVNPRLADDAAELEARAQVCAAGAQPTPVIGRFWFKSIYFREPGGSLFEIATRGPGFAVDEDPATLGEQLILPPWLEPERAAIERGLQPVRLPLAGAGAAGQ